MNFHLLRTDPKTYAITYDVNVSIAWNASASTFQNMLNNFDIFYGYNPSVVLTKFDAAGLDISATAAAGSKYVWTVTLNNYRPPSATSQTFLFTASTLTTDVGSPTPTITEVKSQAHSPPLSGTFTLSLDNVLVTFYNSTSKTNQVDIPYNTNAWDLAAWIQQSWNCPYAEVDIPVNQGFADGVTYIISWIGCPGSKSLVVSDASKLTGGNTGSTVVMPVWRTRAASTNLLVEPISGEYLFGAASTSQVVVTVNDIQSECQGDCSYAINATVTPIIASSVYNSVTGVLTLNITDPGLLGFIPADVTVTIDGTPCPVSLASTIDALTCTVQSNDAGAPKLRAGSYKPVVEIKNVGFARPGASVSDITVGLVLSSLSNNTAPLSGGTIVGISGSGFPFDATGVTVNICGTTAFVNSVTNSQVGIMVPPCPAASASTGISVTYNGITSNTLAFTYDPTIVTPSISGVSPTSASPVLKNTMTVTGSGFGTDTTQLTAYLVNGTGFRTYQLNVLTATDTQVTVRLSGGLSGTFTVVINKRGFGDSVEATVGAAQFKYEIVVTGVSPSVGSIAGGTVITITGRNFSPVKSSNQVAIGDALNWWCTILTATATQITCTTPPISSQYTVLTHNVVVVGRAMIDSTCDTGATCTFTYDNSSYPTVTVPTSLTYTAGTSYTLSGTGFINNGVNPKVNVGGTWATVASSTNTSVVFFYPALPFGTYPLNVYVDGIGYAYSNPPIVSNTTLAVTGLSPTTGSKIGNVVTVNGNGLVSKTDPNFKLTITKSGVIQPYTIVGDTPTGLSVLLMGGTDGSVFTFTYTYKTQVWANNYTTLNTSTPKLTHTVTTGVTYSPTQSVSLNRVNFVSASPNTLAAFPVTSTGARFGESIQLPFTTSGAALVVNTSALGAGKWQFELFYNGYGYADVTPQYEVLAPTYTVAAVTSSYTGGALLTVAATGASNLSKLDVGGFPAKLISYSATNLVYQVPAYVTTGSQETFHLVQDGPLTGQAIADTIGSAANSFDQLMSTYYSSIATTCYVGVDFGQYLTANISRIRYFPFRDWKSAGKYLIGATLKASNDGTAWTTLYTIDSTVHTGWNIWRPATPLTTTYRYVKFEHNATSGCKLAEFEVSGVLVASTSTTAVSDVVDVHFSDGFHTATWPTKVTYQATSTPVISSLNPTSASPAGGSTLTITGRGFGTDSSVVSVLVDDIACVVTSTIDTQIVCTVGARPNLPDQLSFVVSINGNVASKNVADFFYAYRWTDPATWGGDIPPIDGDTVYVPKGMVLLVDQSTPNLKTIIVEGSIIFADEQEMVIETGSIIVNFGVFRAGTEKVPYTNKLTFLLHGGYYDKQLPGFGNKAIGCHCCKFDMYGTPRLLTWSELSVTADVGATNITITDTVDWAIGETIVIASTSHHHYESERRVITAIDTNTKVISFDDPLLYKHISVVETVGSGSFPMRAEVGLLTRNILVTGDSDSVPNKYGAHIMMHGPSEQGLVGHIAYTEVTQCGQPAIVGRYCIHFHMNGDVTDSYVIGNSVHDSFARILTLHGVHYLTVKWNVGHIIHGHNFFLEDGIETYNVIEHNLAISTIQVWNMLQTDISAASYWITNPLNTVRYNHAAGGDFYGFWYEIKDHPDGPSASSDICPQGMPVGESHDNVAHTYVRFGLRTFKLFSSNNPCMPPRDDSLADPWSANPSIQNTFYNYLIWMCSEAGLLAEQTGNTIFNNFTIADSGMAGAQFHQTNFSREFVILQNSIIVGRTTNNGRPLANLTDVYGIITPRTDGFKASNIAFHKFPSQMTVFKSCSVCENELVRTTVGVCSYFSGISYTDVNASYIFWNIPYREVYYDLDGSLSGTDFDGVTRTSATVIPYFTHMDIAGQCNNATNPPLWNGSLVCGSSTVVRKIMFTNPMPTSWFPNTKIKFAPLTTPGQDISAITSGYTGEWMIKTKADRKVCWAAPFAMNKFYDTWWNEGIDFTHMAVVPSQYFDQNDAGVVLRFNHTENRELFEIGLMVGGTLQMPFIVPKTAQLDPSTCNVGDYYHDVDNKYLYLCVSGKNSPLFPWIDVNGIKCRYLCPQPEGEFVKEPFIRLWSNATQWPGGVMPSAGQNVTVNGNWTIIMDVDPARADMITINGDVFVGDRDTTISANAIWIRAGSLNAGNATSPFGYKLNINLLGNKTSSGYTINPHVAGNKFMVVTGTLSLYGKPPSTVWTRLTAKAAAGATTISVASTTGWAVGDELAIAPSFNNYTEYEKVTISAISGTTVTFTPALNFTHFGDTSATVSNTYGTLDMRAGVGHLTRNISINAGADSGYGFRVLTNGFLDGTIVRKGATTLVGVRLNNGGQVDTDYAAAHFLETAGNEKLSLVRGCAFVDSSAFSMRLENNANVTVDNNVFYLAKKFIVSVEGQQDYKFTNNLLIGALVRPTQIGALMADDMACYHQYVALPDPANDNNLVKGNLCQGSAWTGFVFPHTPCELLGRADQGFIDNTAGSATMGFMMNTVPGACLGGERLKAYATEIGFLANPPGPKMIQYQGMMFADNGRGLGLRHGTSGDNNTAILKDSWVSGLARPNCNYCYGSTATDCHGNHALRLLVSANGEHFPDKFSTSFDVVCNLEAFDSKAFLYNVTFDNYKQSYTGTGLSTCGNNVVFKPHPGAHDLTGSHHLTLTYCTNCDSNSYAYFTPPNPNELGWMKGCGSILCTGMNNYIIQDHDGTFLGQPGTLVANNSWVGTGESGCTFNVAMNGYVCLRDDIAVLEYESIAPDFNTRIMWPVMLNYWGGNWTSVTNGWREWDWKGPEPQNRRLARFVSTIRLGQVYNMTFSAQPPSDMRFQIQHRTLAGNASEWLAIRIYYPVANAISVMIGRTPIDSILATSDEDVTNRSTVCGANKYFYKNGTIAFIVTGHPSCQVRVTLNSNVQITARLMVSINTFFDNNGVATFVDKMCSFLNITTDRLKVVGVYEGSAVVDAYVLPVVNTTADNSTTTTVNPVEQRASLQAIADKLASAAPNSIGLGGVLGPVVSSTSTVNIINTDGSAYTDPVAPTDNASSRTTIIIAVVVSVLSAALIGVTTWLVIKKIRARGPIEPEFTGDRSNVDIELQKDVEVMDMDMQ